MALNHNLTRYAWYSARSVLSVLLLVALAFALVACQAPESADEKQRMFVAVDLPPLTSDRASNRYADGNWLKIALQGTNSNRSAIGARITVEFMKDGTTRSQTREISTHSGWRSQGELTQHVGLGNVTKVSKVVIKWPSGHVQTIAQPPINQVLNVLEGN